MGKKVVLTFVIIIITILSIPSNLLAIPYDWDYNPGPFVSNYLVGKEVDLFQGEFYESLSENERIFLDRCKSEYGETASKNIVMLRYFNSTYNEVRNDYFHIHPDLAPIEGHFNVIYDENEPTPKHRISSRLNRDRIRFAQGPDFEFWKTTYDLGNNDLYAWGHVIDVFIHVPGAEYIPDQGKWPYGYDPMPITDDIIYPMQVRDWNYLRQFGVNSLPSYNDMALLEKKFPDSRTLENDIEMVGRMHYVILRNKQTRNYQVHLMGREFRAEDGQAAGVTLNWQPPILWGLFGGYYQAKGNPPHVASTYHSFAYITPERGYQVQNPQQKDGGWLPYKVQNTYEVVEFGVFMGDTGQEPPDVVNPPPDDELPPEYDPDFDPRDPIDDGLLIYLFVPPSLDYLPLFQSLGKIAEPVEGVVQIFSDIAEFTPTYNLPPAVIMETDISPHIQQVFEIPVPNFLGQNVTVIQGIRLLSSCFLGFIILKSLWRFGLKIFGGGEE